MKNLSKIFIFLLTVLLIISGIIIYKLVRQCNNNINVTLDTANEIFEINKAIDEAGFILEKEDGSYKLNKKESELKDGNEILEEELEEASNTTKKQRENYDVKYHIEGDTFYTDDNNVKIISSFDAAKIAEKEAKKDKYQYQSWKSEFYAIGEDNNETLVATLLDGTKSINIKDEWKNSNYNDETIIWKIRLFDRVDPLTSLLVYVNALDGTIIGAEELSD